VKLADAELEISACSCWCLTAFFAGAMSRSDDRLSLPKDASKYGSVPYALPGGSAEPSAAPKCLLQVCALICVVELCERLAFYTFNGTQTFFLERCGFSLATASAINAACLTLCMTLTVVAGWVADAHLGRFKTILVFGVLYVVGACLASVAAWPLYQSGSIYLIGLMIFVPFGTAGIKANISNFGAEQFDVSTLDGKIAQERFFSWFYVSINIGAAFAYGFLTTFGSTGGFGVPSEYGYFTVYSVSALCMFFAVIIFAMGRPLYTVTPTTRSTSFGAVCRYLGSAVQQGSPKAAAALLGISLILLGLLLSVSSSLAAETVYATPLTYAAGTIMLVGIGLTIGCNLRPDWVGAARLLDEDLSAQDIMDFFRLIPVLLTGHMAFGALYNSMQFWYQLQACQMDLHIWPGSAQQVSGSFFNVADCVAIVLCTPILVGLLHPALEKATGIPMSYGTKFCIGMVVAGTSVLLAAWFEVERRASPTLPIASNCAPHGIKMSSMHAGWMLLPYFLMGIAEIYIMPTLMFFAYNQAPPSMRTLSTVMGLFMMGITAAVFSVFVLACSIWVPDDLNKGNLERGYYANIALAATFYILFLSIMALFQEKTYYEVQ